MDLRFSEWRALEDLAAIPKLPGIYIIRNLETNQKYVGQSVNMLKRVRVHFWAKNPVSYLHRAINCYGFKAFEVQFALVGEDKLSEAEVWCIKEFNTQAPNGYNLTWGGEGSTGYVMQESSKKKLSDSIKGLPKPAYFGLKISAANRARWADPEARKRQGEHSRGRKHTDEAKAKLSAARMGNIPATRKAVCVDLHGVKAEFVSIKEAAAYLQVAPSVVINILSGKEFTPSMWENRDGKLVRVIFGPTRWYAKYPSVNHVYQK